MSDIENYLYYGISGFVILLDDQLQHPTNRSIGARFLLEPFNQLRLPQEMAHRECCIWVYVSFGGITRFHDLSYSNGIYDSLLREFLGSRDWECLEEFFRKLLWTESMVPRWKCCWKEAMQRLRQADYCV